MLTVICKQTTQHFKEQTSRRAARERWSPRPTQTHNHKGVAGALPASKEGIGYLMESSMGQRENPTVDLTGHNFIKETRATRAPLGRRRVREYLRTDCNLIVSTSALSIIRQTVKQPRTDFAIIDRLRRPIRVRYRMIVNEPLWLVQSHVRAYVACVCVCVRSVLSAGTPLTVVNRETEMGKSVHDIVPAGRRECCTQRGPSSIAFGRFP
ncbi:hypothetical protein EVAR_86161_1 [Eumeta japonica]|uniref:Uncharacterized protein n=1 Tax=Eumeta variegata TaxID=151549 RepID=A0A4C1Z1R9_EUMVA|nr:hypothetical protein EVAR_86161_1 [Eumeta japonica]